jgi:hypothetical protein
MEKLTDFLFISLLIVVSFIAYRLILKKLSKGKLNVDDFCILYSLEKNPSSGEIEFYFVSPRTMKIEFSIWKEDNKVLELSNDYFNKGGQIIRFDSRLLPNGEYFFGIVTSNQKTIKRFSIENA